MVDWAQSLALLFPSSPMSCLHKKRLRGLSFSFLILWLFPIVRMRLNQQANNNTSLIRRLNRANWRLVVFNFHSVSSACSCCKPISMASIWGSVLSKLVTRESWRSPSKKIRKISASNNNSKSCNNCSNNNKQTNKRFQRILASLYPCFNDTYFTCSWHRKSSSHFRAN